MDKRVKRFAIGTVVAAAAGYIAGILTAPKSGKETRADIKNAAEKGVAEAERQLKRLHTELSELIRTANERLTQLKGTAHDDLEKAVAATKTAKEKARELLSAVHEGVADDKDLKKAIEEANKAAEHLKAFLAKK